MPKAPNLELVQRIAQYRWDPLRYVLFNWQWDEPGPLEGKTGPRDWQREEFQALGEHLQNPKTRHTPYQLAIAAGHGVGKSAFISMLTKWAVDTCVDCRCVVTANTESQLRTKTWPEVSKWHGLSLTEPWMSCPALSLYANDAGHEKTWRADAIPWSENRPESFAGLHNEGKRILIVFDEASAIPDIIWETARGALTDENTEIIWVCMGNPTRATGEFRECFRKYRKQWRTRHIDSRTVEGTNKDYLNTIVEQYGENSDVVKVRVKGQFPAQSAKQFFSEDLYIPAMGRHLDEARYSWAPKVLCVDPAWDGDDDMIIGLRQGLCFKILRVIPKNDNDIQMAGVIAALEDEHDADAVFIDFGYGTGIKSAGDYMGRTWVLVNFAEGSPDPGCLNLRSYCYKQVREWLRQGGAVPNDQQLQDEFGYIETVTRLDGKLQLLGKKEMKALRLPSPNKLDSLAVSFAYPVETRVRQLGQKAQQVTNWDYDPIG